VKENYSYSYYNYAVIKAKNGQVGKSTVLKITSSKGATKEIPVNITKKAENAPGFEMKAVSFFRHFAPEKLLTRISYNVQMKKNGIK